MKKIFIKSLFVIATIFVLDSCNSSLSITKRRYTKGYYVHQTPKSTHTKETTAQAPKNKRHQANNKQISKKINPTISQQKNKEQDLLTASAAQPTKTRKISHINNNSTIPVDQIIGNPVKTFKELHQKINESHAPAGVFSLMWILILILLIAYILGLLLSESGIGWAIHLLLIAALVLLILWLLHIV